MNHTVTTLFSSFFERCNRHYLWRLLLPPQYIRSLELFWIIHRPHCKRFSLGPCLNGAMCKNLVEDKMDRMWSNICMIACRSYKLMAAATDLVRVDTASRHSHIHLYESCSVARETTNARLPAGPLPHSFRTEYYSEKTRHSMPLKSW